MDPDVAQLPRRAPVAPYVKSRLGEACATVGAKAAADQGRAARLKRLCRAPAADDPRGVLAASVCPFAGTALYRARARLDEYLTYFNYDRAHTGRLTQGRIPADIVFGTRKTTSVR